MFDRPRAQPYLQTVGDSDEGDVFVDGDGRRYVGIVRL